VIAILPSTQDKEDNQPGFFVAEIEHVRAFGKRSMVFAHGCGPPGRLCILQRVQQDLTVRKRYLLGILRIS